MDVMNCPRCGRLFTYAGKSLCPKCLEGEEDQFKKVRTYVRDHPGATISQTAEDCDVDEEVIISYLREGRLISKGLQSSVVLRCERCDLIIPEGRFCKKCAEELDNRIRKTIGGGPVRSEPDPEPEPKQRSRDRMHSIDLPPRR